MTLSESIFVAQPIEATQLYLEKIGHCQVGLFASLFPICTFENNIEVITLKYKILKHYARLPLRGKL